LLLSKNLSNVVFPKIQNSRCKSRHILGIAPQDKKNNSDLKKLWAEKIIDFLNNNIKWKFI
jgi:hypothetical protein